MGQTIIHLAVAAKWTGAVAGIIREAAASGYTEGRGAMRLAAANARIVEQVAKANEAGR